MMSEQEKPKEYHALLITFLIILIIFTAINSFTLSSFGKAKLAKQIEKANVNVILLETADCPQCARLTSVMQTIQGSNTVSNQKNVQANSPEGKDILTKYQITKVPAAIVTGEIDKAVTGTQPRKQDNALIIESTLAPYFDVKTQKMEGLVTITQLSDTSCINCFDIETLITQLKQAVQVKQVKKIGLQSEEGKKLVSQYKITKVPTVILSQEASLYPLISESWESIGTQEQDGTLVMRHVLPPYKEVVSGTIKGKVEIIRLVDATCTACYNVSLHDLPLKRFGMPMTNAKTVDVSSDEGKKMMKEYNITLVPTVVLKGDVNEYNLVQTWRTVGTIEKDGTYVFRNMGALQGSAYKDLATGKMMK